MKKDFLALDVETANHAPYSICEIGLVFVRDLEIVDSHRYLVKPPNNEYHFLNSQIHGISAVDTLNELTFSELWTDIQSHFLNNLLVAHNAAFDIKCIHEALAFYQISEQRMQYECTYTLTGLNLTLAAAAYKIQLEHHHALSDAEACAKIYIQIQKGIMPDLSKADITLFEKKSVLESFQKKKVDKLDLQPDFENADKSSPFYMKIVVFTGDMQHMERKEAAHIAKDLGADVNTSISKKTDFVIIGERPGPSKMKKIKDLQFQGFPLKVLNEGEFLSLIKEFSV